MYLTNRGQDAPHILTSLSARRAWIEIFWQRASAATWARSLSARRAWIEIAVFGGFADIQIVALRKESVDRNICSLLIKKCANGRSPQGERG